MCRRACVLVGLLCQKECLCDAGLMQVCQKEHRRQQGYRYRGGKRRLIEGERLAAVGEVLMSYFER